MSTPNLVQTIAVVLHWHSIGIDPQRNNAPVCTCGEVLTDLDNPEEHQALEILEAISKAGNVEWGVAWDGLTIDPMQAVSLEAAKATAVRIGTISNDGNPPYAITRFAGPWTAVEG